MRIFRRSSLIVSAASRMLALLAACEMGDEVDIRREGKNLVIASVKAPRSGWFEGYKPEVDSEPLATQPADEGSEEWVW